MYTTSELQFLDLSPNVVTQCLPEKSIILDAANILTSVPDIIFSSQHCNRSSLFIALENATLRYELHLQNIITLNDYISNLPSYLCFNSHPPITLFNSIEPASIASIYYRYTSHLYRILYTYSQSIKLDSTENELINLKETSILTKLYYFLLNLCAVPYLVPAQSIPISHRPQTIQDLLKHKSSSITVITLAYHLISFLDITYILLYGHQSITLPILITHLRDIMATLIQVLKFNGLKIAFDNKLDLTSQECLILQSIKFKILEFIDKFDEFLAPFPTSRVVNELLVLQGLALKTKSKSPWAVKFISHRLQKILVRPNGLQYVLRGYLDGIATENSNNTDIWHNLSIISKAITTIPNGWSDTDYFSHLSNELLTLLHWPDVKINTGFSQAILNVIHQTSLSFPFHLETLFLGKIFNSLNELCSCPPNFSLVKMENALLQTFEDIFTIYTGLPELTNCLLEYLLPYIPVLFRFYVFDIGNLTTTKFKIGQILSRLISLETTNIIYDMILNILSCIYFTKNPIQTVKLFSPKISLILTEQCHISVVLINKEGDSDSISERMSRDVEAIFSLIGKTEICPNFLEIAVKLFTELLFTIESNLKSSSALESQRHSCPYYKTGILLLVATCFENCGEMIVTASDTKSIIELCIKCITIHYEASKKYSTMDEYSKHVIGGNISLQIVFSILTLLLSSNKEVTKDTYTMLNSTLNMLEAISKLVIFDSLISSQAEDLRICIATYGAYFSYTFLAENESIPKNTLKSDSNITYSSAMLLARDSLLPIKANGIINLTKLIETGDTTTLDNSDLLFSLFKLNLKHSDSYLYLASINGLASLANVKPNEVISEIASQFALFYTPKSKPFIAEMPNSEQFNYDHIQFNDSNTPEFRIKLGEVLLKACVQCGEVFPYYSKQVICAILCAIRDEDYLVRASGLSILGDVSILLGYTLSKYLIEIVSCIDSLIPFEPECTVRQAAVKVLTKLLDRPKHQITAILDGHMLKLIYNLLKKVYANDPDHVTRLHAQTGLESVNSIMKEILTPLEDLTKRIYVLDPPLN